MCDILLFQVMGDFQTAERLRLEDPGELELELICAMVRRVD